MTVAPELTDETVAAKFALVPPEATVTDAGTITALLLLARFTGKPAPVAAAFKVTVQLSVPAPVIEPFAQLSPLNAGVPVPLKSIVVDVPVDESLLRTTVPVAAPDAVGSNCTASVAVLFGLIVRGKDSPEIENPAPVTVAPLTVTAAVPVEVNVMVCALARLTATVPKETLAALNASVGTVVPSASAKDLWRLPALAVIVTVCGVAVAVAVRLKLAFFWPDATVTDAGTVTAVLLLAILTAIPLLSAEVFNVTVQVSEPDPLIEPVAQANPLTIGMPLPDRPTLRAAPSEELLASDNCPLSLPAPVGSNCTLRSAVCPGLSVIGKLAPGAEYPVPESVASLTVTGAVPVDESVKVCVADELTSTLPKSIVPVLTVSAAVTAVNCNEKSCVMFPALAVSVAVCERVTAVAVASKSALVAPAATVTDAGTVTALLLLARFTCNPLVPAGALSSTVQLSVVDPVIELLVQLNAVNVVAVAAAVPVPLSATTTLLTPDVLLAIANCPEAAPMAAGLNCTVKVKVLLGLTLAGSALWLVTENDCPLTVICEITTGADPSLVTVMFVLALCPTLTDPNATVCVDAVNEPAAVVFDETDAIGAVQPDRTKPQSSSAMPTCGRADLSKPAQKGELNTLQRESNVTIYDYRVRKIYNPRRLP